MVNAVRVQERELWAILRQFDQNLRAAGTSASTLGSNVTDPLIFPQPTTLRASLSAYIDSISSPRMSPAMAAQAEQILYNILSDILPRNNVIINHIYFLCISGPLRKRLVR